MPASTCASTGGLGHVALRQATSCFEADAYHVLTSVPWELFEADGQLKGHSSDSCGVAMTFLPTTASESDQVKSFFKAQAERRGLEVLGWRAVPQRKEVLGEMALKALPDIQQAFLHHPTLRGDELEVLLYEARRSIPTPPPP